MKKLISLLLAVGMLLSLAACGSSESSADSGSTAETVSADEVATADVDGTTNADGERVLRVGCMESGGGFCPWGQDQSTIGNNLVYDRIVQRMPDGVCEPWLCESYEWTDDTTLVFQLKDGIYFSDGDQLVGEDLIYAFAQQMNGVQASYYSALDIDNCTVSDDGLTVTFKFTEPYGAFEAMLDTPQITNKSAVESRADDDSAWWDQPIGTGPYECVENVAGSHATYRLRDGYWNTDMQLDWDEIIVNYYTEATAMFIAFENGELDVVCSVANTDAARLQSGDTALGDAAAYEFIGTNNVYDLTLNNNREELQDPKVREAIAHAIDTDGLGQVAFGVLYQSADSILSPGCNYYKSEGAYEYDVEYAKQCMAESNYPDGFTLNVVAINSTEVTGMWQVIQGGLAEIGIDLEFQSYELGTALTMWMEPEGNDMMLMSVNGGNPMREPYLCLSMTMSTSPFPAANINDADYQEHFNASIYTSDTSVRATEYEWLQDWCHENFQCLPMVEDMSCYAYNTNTVASCEFYTGGSPDLLWCHAAN